MRAYFLLVFLISSLTLIGQHTDHEDHEDHKHAHGHEHHNNEIGLAIAPVYFVSEKSTALGLHLHYIRSLHHSKWGLGVGYEKILDEHSHNILGGILSYRPISPLSFSLSPGINFSNSFKNIEFAIHGEVAYEFEIGDLHLGPVLDLARDHDDFHISLGVHIGIGF